MSIMKATAISPANIAFIKYWGKRDDRLTLAQNPSISMNLSGCLTKTTVEFSPTFKKDQVLIKFYGHDFEEVEGKKKDRVIAQVDRLRQMKGTLSRVKIVSENSFPADAGIASSASAFSALTLALAGALGLKASKKELSVLTRLGGSGSACRSIFDGFVEWKKGTDSDSSCAVQLAPADHWEIADLVAVVRDEQKEFSSLHGHALATGSPFYEKRQELLKKRVRQVRKAIRQKDWPLLGKCTEEEAVEMHLVAMSAKQPIFYWNEGTFEVIHYLLAARKKGLWGFFTMDAGPNVHIICQKKDLDRLDRQVRQLKNVSFTIKNTPCQGARLVNQHLF